MEYKLLSRKEVSFRLQCLRQLSGFSKSFVDKQMNFLATKRHPDPYYIIYKFEEERFCDGVENCKFPCGHTERLLIEELFGIPKESFGYNDSLWKLLVLSKTSSFGQPNQIGH